jgi:hypothetical protein
MAQCCIRLAYNALWDIFIVDLATSGLLFEIA